MKAVVIDNCTLCRFRFKETNWHYVQPLIDDIKARQVIAYAPPHLLIEFYHVAQRCLGSHPNRSRIVKRHEDWLLSLKLQFMPVEYLTVARELRLLVNRGVGSYDAIYIHLARKLGHPLWTCDAGIIALQPRRLGVSVVDLHSAQVVP